jgi:hypothetical protein
MDQVWLRCLNPPIAELGRQLHDQVTQLTVVERRHLKRPRRWVLSRLFVNY